MLVTIASFLGLGWKFHIVNIGFPMI